MVISFLSGAGHAEPITIAELNWEMTGPAMRVKLEGRGYTCEGTRDMYGCTKGRKAVVIFSNSEIVTFNCEVFNGCGLNYQEVAQELVNAGIVNQMEGTYVYQSPGYKGRGVDGDLIETYNDPPKIDLSRGALGSGGLNFD
ncbi:hypothetical protein [Yoonia sp.]|uniref:hypothetical protein n=1 Tax=Yoonia sp. TaxID=2212373 RepID=UPI00404840D0